MSSMEGGRVRSSKWNLNTIVPGSLRPLDGSSPASSFSSPAPSPAVQPATQAASAIPTASSGAGSGGAAKPAAAVPVASSDATEPHGRGRGGSDGRAAARGADGAVATAGDSGVAAEAAAAQPSAPPPVVTYRVRQWVRVMGREVVDLEALKKLSWNGVPGQWRPAVWQLMLGYLPSDAGRRAATVARKRREYSDAVAQHFDLDSGSSMGEEYRTPEQQRMLRQVLVDVPRTSPDVPLFHQANVQRCLERILYVWSLRHPASGYVQGMNDLATPLFVVFLTAALLPAALATTSAGAREGAEVAASLESPPGPRGRCPLVGAVESLDAQRLPEGALADVEADTYWCLTKLLDHIQDHYTAGQPGLQRQMYRLEELIRRVDSPLHGHLADEGVGFSFFSFRWMNNLLMRELPLQAVVRLWDTCLAEDEAGHGFEGFHVFVCAAFLKHFSALLVGSSGEELMTLLQELPTSTWGPEDVETLLSEAFVLSSLYRDSPAQLTQHSAAAPHD